MNIQYEIQLHTYWHCGSGLAAGADVDALAIKDKDGLPFIPGKTIKGLIREAVDEILTLKSDETNMSVDYVKTFGLPIQKQSLFSKGSKITEKSEAFFSNACLRKEESDAIKANGLARFMFDSVSQTAIGKNGVAREHSLRKIEIVHPCVLEGEILNVPEGMVDNVVDAMKYTKYLGLGRNRGLGRCTFTITKEQKEKEKEEDKANESVKSSDTLQFKCRLLSDVILNQKAAIVGPNNTLDFIPGNNFLGIAASVLYPNIPAETAIELFHAKGVRFGDAHLGKEKSNDDSQNIRGLKVPACMYKPKLEEGLYIMYGTDKKSEDIRRKQLKQCRSGYYDFTSVEAEKIESKTNFAIKSAHDKNSRTSAESQMYGYESLEKDLVLFFEVEVDDNEAYKEQIKTALVGKKRIGRSRSAQYGLVEIEETSFTQPKSNPTSGDITVVYADSRLIFLDEKTGMPTYQPSPKALGIENGKIVWDDCQVRTFQYAPWNFKRKCFDTDRCGIEAGCVFVVKGGNLKIKSYIGSYNNEGFGKVIYNPNFLKFKEGGEAVYSLNDSENIKEDDINPSEKTNLPNSVVAVLLERKAAEDKEEKIYKLVNNWVENNKKRFASEAFASQWGKIRSLAMQGDIYNRLFAENTGYLKHGIGEEKWSKGGRKKLLEDFVNNTNLQTDKDRCMAVVNLASEMAKIK